MPESLDIVAKIDSDPKFGPTNFIKPFSGRKDLEAWQKTVKKANSLFQRSRYMKVYLPEFATQDGRNAFVNNHPLGSYEKPEWKKELTMEQKWKMYNDAFEESLANIDSTNEALKKLDDLIHCHMCCTEGGISMDDIDLWSRLRSLTIVKGLVWPEKLRKYMEYFSDVADVPLYTSMAL
jgi:glutaredoxin 2